MGGKRVKQSFKAKYSQRRALSKRYFREGGRLQTGRHRLALCLRPEYARARVGCGLAAASWFPQAPWENHEIIKNPLPRFSFPKDLNAEAVIYTDFRCFSLNQRGRKFPLSCQPGWLPAVPSANRAGRRRGGKSV